MLADMQRLSFAIRCVWALCLLAAGYNHAALLIEHGLAWDYGGVPWLSAVYWSSLTILDPLAAALLFVRPRVGIICTIALIVTNVVHNISLTAARVPASQLADALSNPLIMSQTGFMLLVGLTARWAWAGATEPGVAANPCRAPQKSSR
jgi:hypothetical protein